jgi:hypothetical protein
MVLAYGCGLNDRIKPASTPNKYVHLFLTVKVESID